MRDVPVGLAGQLHEASVADLSQLLREPLAQRRLGLGLRRLVEVALGNRERATACLCPGHSASPGSTRPPAALPGAPGSDLVPGAYRQLRTIPVMRSSRTIRQLVRSGSRRSAAT
jgi:hypothetical protein